MHVLSFARPAALMGLVVCSSPALAQDEPAQTPSAFAQPPPPHISPSGRVGMVAGGATLVVVGLGTTGAGALLTWFSLTSHACAACMGCGCEPPPYALLGLAIPLDLLALASVVGGFVMIAVGAHRAPAQTVSVCPLGLRLAW